MRINYKNWPVLKAIKNFGFVSMMPRNLKAFRNPLIKGSESYQFFENIFHNADYYKNITYVRQTFEEDAYKNKDKLWSLFVNDIWNSPDSKIQFEHTGILLKKNRAIWYNFSKSRQNLQVYIFIDNGIYVGSAFNRLTGKVLDENELKIRVVPNDEIELRFNKPLLHNPFVSEFTMCIIDILFKQFANVETKYLEPNEKRIDKKTGNKDLNESDFGVTILDSTWYTNLIRSEGFKVSGHPRLQPCKIDGEWTYKLIWINEFMKHGYNRKAKKEIQNSIA